MRKFAAKGLIILALLMGGLTTLYAQTTPPDISIITTIPTPKDDAMELQLYFTIPNYPGSARPTKGEIQITSGEPRKAEATISDPKNPIRIALVLDISGSIAETKSTDNLKKAAEKAVDDAPDNSEIALYLFNYDLELKQDFTSNRELLKGFIRGIKPDGGTCLYYATFKALEHIMQIAPTPQDRRAVIVFTDGQDTCGEEKNPKIDKSSYTPELILAKATDKAISTTPIYTIGLCSDNNDCSKVDQGLLERISNSTSAFSSTTGRDDLASKFSKIMTALKNQWIATAKILAHNGKNEAVLRISSDDSGNNTYKVLFNFDSAREYILPSKIEALQPIYDPNKNQYLFDLKLSQPDKIENIAITVLQGSDKEGQTRLPNVKQGEVASRSKVSPTETDVMAHYFVSAQNFSLGQKYCFQFQPLDKANKPVADAVQTCVEKHDPTPSLPKINFGEKPRYERTQDLYRLKLRISRPEIVGKVEVEILEDNRSAGLPLASLEIPKPTTIGSTLDTEMIIPAKNFKLSAKQYSFTIRAYNRDGQLFDAFVDGSTPQPQLVSSIKDDGSQYTPVGYEIKEITTPDPTLKQAHVTLDKLQGGFKPEEVSVKYNILDGSEPLVTNRSVTLKSLDAFEIDLPAKIQQITTQKPYKLQLWLSEGDHDYKMQEKEFTVKPLPQPDWLTPLLAGLALVAVLVAAFIFYRRSRSSRATPKFSPFNQEQSGSRNLPVPINNTTALVEPRPETRPAKKEVIAAKETKQIVAPPIATLPVPAPEVQQSPKVSEEVSSSTTSTNMDTGRTIFESEDGTIISYTIAEPASVVHWFVEIVEGDKPERFELSALERDYEIGRITPSNTPYIGINSERISRKHAKIRVKEDSLELTDEGSNNHTYVGETKQKLEAAQPYLLQSGDVFWLGKQVKLRVESITITDN